MTEDFAGRDRSLTDQTAELVAAYVSNNHVALGDLPELIAIVQDALSGLTAATTPSSAEAGSKPLNGVQIRKSITPDALISFIDGKPYKTLKRHLRRHGLDPYTYCIRYGLPVDYPMVAASYSARRTELSRMTGLGRGRLGRASMNGAA